MSGEHPGEPLPEGPISWRPDRSVAISPDGSEVWMFAEQGPVRLAGLGAGPLAAAVDGHRSLQEVVDTAVAGGMPPADARRIGSRWLRAGHLVPTPPAEPPARVAVVDCSSTDDGPAAAARFRAALECTDVEVAAPREAPDLTVLLVDDLLDTESAVAGAPRPCLVVQLRGPHPMASPLLDRTGTCPRCLVDRLRLRRAMDLVAAARVARAGPPPSPVIHPVGCLTMAAVAAAAARAAATGGPMPADQLLAADPQTGQVLAHAVVPVAGCPDCDPGGPAVAGTHLERPVRPEPGQVDTELEINRDTGFRVVDPEETWQQYRRHISDVVGLVPYVTPTGPPALRAFSAGPNVAAGEDLVMLKSRLRSAAGGKGITLSAARTGALAEALERDTLRARGTEPSRRARMADLPTAIHPNDIQLFSDRQLDRVARLRALGIAEPAGGKGFHRVPLPFDTDAEHDWSPVADIRTGEVHWLPSSLLWLNWPKRPPDYPAGCSNGAAAGNSVEEALLQGLLELVERDAVALWWYPRCRRPRINLDEWDDPRIEAALAPQRAIGADTWVLDLTTDLGIPAAVAVGLGGHRSLTAPLLGFGAHLDPVLAVVRALTELSQMQAPLVAMAGAGELEFPGEAERTWFAEVTPEKEPWLAPDGIIDPVPAPVHCGIGEALDDAVARVAGAGLSVLWADCTRPDVGLPVVRTWAPGLRHFWNRFAPGRLYEVPPRLGWCRGGYGEDDLNPLAMIL